MRVAAIFPVGISAGGAQDAIVNIRRIEPALDVYLLPGKKGDAEGAKDPRQLAEQIRDSANDPRVNCIVCDSIEPYNLSETYRYIREWIADFGVEHDYERVYVGVTGGTNPMVASLFQAATTYLHDAVVVPVYIQANGQNFQASFEAADIHNRVIAEDVLRNARSFHLQLASQVAERLPKVERWKFLREAVTAFAQWDDFDYGPASSTLVQQADKCAALASDDLLGPLSETVARIAAHARDLRYFTEQLDRNKFAAAASTPGWAQRVEDCGMLLVADALANANRRSVESRYTDSVLRSYRAAECATQMRLFKIGIHPSKPTANLTAYRRWIEPSAGPENKVPSISFDKGLKILVSVRELDRDSIHNSVRSLQQLRNESYLEHGYRRASQQDAARCFDLSLEICRALLGSLVDDKWHHFEMQF